MYLSSNPSYFKNILHVVERKMSLRQATPFHGTNCKYNCCKCIAPVAHGRSAGQMLGNARRICLVSSFQSLGTSERPQSLFQVLHVSTCWIIQYVQLCQRCLSLAVNCPGFTTRTSLSKPSIHENKTELSSILTTYLLFPAAVDQGS